MTQFMTSQWLNPKMILALMLIITSVAIDLRTKKVPNKLIIIGFAMVVILVSLVDGVSGFWPAAASLGAAVVFSFPLYSLRAIAAGDVKLILVLSLLISWNLTITMIFASMIWGSILGIARVILDGKTKQFFQNLLLVFKKSSTPQQNLSHIPYTVAILFGFLTAVELATAGISWL